MKERQDLVDALAEHPCCFTREEAEAKADAFAHALAERIRDGYTGDGPDEDNWILSAFDAARLIDPESGP